MKIMKTLALMPVLALAMTACSTTSEEPTTPTLTKNPAQPIGTSHIYQCRLDKSSESPSFQDKKLRVELFEVEWIGLENLDLIGRDGTFHLTQVLAASGSKYESDDKKTMVWLHQNEASIEANGISYTECHQLN